MAAEPGDRVGIEGMDGGGSMGVGIMLSAVLMGVVGVGVVWFLLGGGLVDEGKPPTPMHPPAGFSMPGPATGTVKGFPPTAAIAP